MRFVREYRFDSSVDCDGKYCGREIDCDEVTFIYQGMAHYKDNVWEGTHWYCSECHHKMRGEK